MKTKLLKLTLLAAFAVFFVSHAWAFGLGMRLGLSDVQNLLSVFLDESPTPGETELTGSEPWNNKEAGFICGTFTPTDLSPGGDQYIADLSDGGASPSSGLSVEQDDDLGLRFRDNSDDVGSITMNIDQTVLEDVKQSACFAWSNPLGQITQVGLGDLKESTFTAGSADYGGDTKWSELNIGQRNGAQESFNGTIHQIEIGNRYQTAQQLGSRIYSGRDDLLNVMVAGQSLATNWFNGTEANGNDGYAGFVSTAAPLYSKEVVLINGGTSGSALVDTTDNTDYFRVLSTQADGPSHDTAVAASANISASPDWLIWAQGEADSHDIDNEGEVTCAEYKSTLLAEFDALRADLNPDMKIGIVGIGRRASGYSNTGGIQCARESQQELANENAYIYVLSYIYDLELTDHVHLTDAAYGIVGSRSARRAAEIDGETVTGSTIGPTVRAVSRSGTEVKVTFTLDDAATTFNPSSTYAGFRFEDDGSAITIDSSTQESAITAALTLNSEPSGAEELFYVWDDAAGITNENLANVIRDNSAQAMPLVPFSSAVTTFCDEAESTMVAEFSADNIQSVSANGSFYNLLSASGEDFFFGSDGSSDAPSIVGTVGTNAYIEGDGDEHLDIKAIGSSVLDGAHRSDAARWYVVAGRHEDTGIDNSYIFGNRTANSDLGVGLRIESNGTVRFLQSNGAASASEVLGFTFTDGADFLLFLSTDGANTTDNIKSWFNSRTETSSGDMTYGASTTDSTNIFSLMSTESSISGSLPAGNRIYYFGYGTGTLDNTKVNAVTNCIQSKYNWADDVITW